MCLYSGAKINKRNELLACFNKKVMLLQIIGRISNYHTDRAYRSS